MVESISRIDKKMEMEIVTKSFRMWLDDHGIVTVVSFLRSEGTIEDSKESLAALLKISGGKKRPVFVNPDRQKSITREARIYSIKNAPDVATAVAILITSPVMQIIANFLIGMNKTINNGNFPLKFFTSEKKAIEWLKQYIN